MPQKRGWDLALISPTEGASGTILRFDGHGRSMRPIICDGDLVVAEPSSSYRPGDILAFDLRSPVGPSKYIHRLIKVVSRDGRKFFISKGDAAPTLDPPVPEDCVLGRVTIIRRPSGAWVDMDSPAVRLGSKAATLVYRAIPDNLLWPAFLSNGSSRCLKRLAQGLKAFARGTSRRGWRALKRPRAWALSGALWLEDARESALNPWTLAHRACAWTLRKWMDCVG